jgi:very-short-patch-repair endonuclease
VGVGKESLKLNPPQSPLVRGEDERGVSRFVAATQSPPLTRGGREGLGFLPYDKELTLLARENRQNPAPAEQKMWREIFSRRQFSGYKFLRQKPIEHFIVDFYCAELAWVIEIDGDSHAEQARYDERRTTVLQQYGLTVIRYDNHDVLNNITGVYDDLVGRLD